MGDGGERVDDEVFEGAEHHSNGLFEPGKRKTEEEIMKELRANGQVRTLYIWGWGLGRLTPRAPLIRDSRTHTHTKHTDNAGGAGEEKAEGRAVGDSRGAAAVVGQRRRRAQGGPQQANGGAQHGGGGKQGECGGDVVHEAAERRGAVGWPPRRHQGALRQQKTPGIEIMIDSTGRARVECMVWDAACGS